MGADDPAQAAPPFDPDDLVRHARFVKSLARDLARDDDEADELAAKTFEAALARRPMGGGSLRVWLKRVVSRLFLRTRRDEARRRRREEAAAPREATAATVDDVARLELEREVAAAFALLAEPYRTTLFLRCYDDLKPREIAARMAVPVETVQTRTKRGLARLREALDARHGGRREAWHAGAIALAAVRVPVAAAVKVKVTLAAAGVVLFVGGGWFATWAVRGRVEAEADRSRLVEASRRGAIAATPSTTTAESSSESNAIREPTAATSLPLLAGVVVDEAGSPVEGAAILPAVIGRDDARNYWVEPLHVDRSKASTVARSGTDGRFHVDSAPRDTVGIHVLKEGFGVADAYDLSADRAANQEVRVVLPKATVIRGQLRDSEGRPIHFASISVSDAEPRTRKRVAENLAGRPSYFTAFRWDQLRTLPDANGAFDLAAIPAGPFAVVICSWGYDLAVLSAEEASAPLDVVLDRNSLILDVVDARTHEPIDDARALVGLKGSDRFIEDVVPVLEQQAIDPSDISPRNRLTLRAHAWWLMKDANSDRHEVRMQVLAPRHRTRSLDVELSPAHEPPHVTVELEPGEDEPSLAGQVLGGAQVHVDVRFPEPERDDSRLQSKAPLRNVDCDSDGGFAIAGLPPASYRLFVSARGCGQRWFDVQGPARDLKFELAPAATLEARVVNSAGAAVEGVALFVQTVDRQRSWIEHTDGDGVAVIDELPGGDVFVAVLGYSRTLFRRPSTIEPELFDPGARWTLVAGERTRMELELPEKRPVFLRLRDSSGDPVADALVRFAGTKGGAAYWQDPDFSDRLDKTVREPMKVESDGSLHLDLFPSRYTFQIEVDELVISKRIAVTANGASEFEIALPIRGRGGTIRGRVVEFGSGRPIASASVRWATGDGTSEPELDSSAKSDADGRFTIEHVPAGPICIAAEGPQGIHGGSARRIDMAANGEVSLELPVARLHIDESMGDGVNTEITLVDDATGAPIEGAWVFVAAEVDGARIDLGDLQSDHDGRAHDRITAAARYTVRTAGPFTPRAPHVAFYEKTNLVVEPIDGLVRATIRLHRKP